MVDSGTAFTLSQIIIGRFVSGLGGAGMSTMITIIITGRLFPTAFARAYAHVISSVMLIENAPIQTSRHSRRSLYYEAI